MASIQQAAVWLDDGKRVWRKAWSHDPHSDDFHEPWESGCREYIYSHRLGSPLWCALGVKTEDLLAKDWEIAE